LNEVTPFFDGNLMYGPNKAWTDAIRLFKDGLLAATNDSTDPDAKDRDRNFPAINDIRLPFANPPPPRDHALKPINRFYSKNVDRIYCSVDYDDSGPLSQRAAIAKIRTCRTVCAN